MMKKVIVAALACAVLAPACKKEEGEGGKAEIRGFLYRKNAGSSDSTAYPDQRVYIVYGDHDFHDDDVRTDGTGKFVFRWLRKGNYRVYAFGECLGATPGCADGLIELSRNVEISGKKEVVVVPSMTAVNY